MECVKQVQSWSHLFTTSLNSSFHVPSLILTPERTLYCLRYSSRNYTREQKRAKTMDNKEQSPGDRVTAHLDGPDVETLVEWKELCDGEAGKVGPCHLNHLEGGGRCVLGGKGRGHASCKDQGTNDFPPS